MVYAEGQQQLSLHASHSWISPSERTSRCQGSTKGLFTTLVRFSSSGAILPAVAAGTQAAMRRGLHARGACSPEMVVGSSSTAKPRMGKQDPSPSTERLTTWR